VLGGDCPAPGPGADQEIAEQAQAVVPLKPGLTLVNLWNPTEQEEYECMNQVTAVHRDGIDLTMTCTKPGGRTTLRRICRADLASARMLHTGVGVATVIGENGEELPETVVGATEFSLSRQEFAELKASGETRHHYVQIGSADRLSWEAVTTLRREGAGKAAITVNGAPVEVPVIRASGDTEIWAFGRRERGRVTAVVLDDERFPMLVDYVHTIGSSTTPRFRLYFPKVTYPGGDPEAELLRRGRLVVHGIYFDFNSDRIRKESDPILKELGEALARHSDWTLSINGHTDNVGGDPYNLALSQRRAAAVRRALVERHGIAAGRLTSSGFGAGAPIDTNDTPEGRARNRRVELVRVEDAPAEPVR
jgi:outer membrane protein OmpA-like peptidoglycan-associated protein